MKRILITGANSYIGTSFEKYLAQWPDEYQVDTIDVRGNEWKEKSFVGYDVVFHVAGIAHTKTKRLDKQSKRQYWAVNAELPVEVAKRSKKAEVPQFVFLSSMSVYGESGSIRHPIVITKETQPMPKDLYGVSKLAAEKSLLDLQSKGFHICIMRPPMVYGPGCRGNYQLLRNAAQILAFFPDINNQRSMLFISNLCVFTRGLIDQRLSGLYFPQDPTYICTSRMVEAIARSHGKRIRMTRALNVPIRVFSGLFPILNKVFGDLTYRVDDDVCSPTVSSSWISFPASVGYAEGER